MIHLILNICLFIIVDYFSVIKASKTPIQFLGLQQYQSNRKLPQGMKKQDETKDELTVDLSLDENIQITQQLLADLIQSEGIECQTVFNSQNIPSISIKDYMKRIHKYTHYSPQCLILAVIYVDRYNMAVPQFSLNWHNVHRLFLTCMMMAVKFQDDIYFDNCSFQKGGGVPISQLLLFQLQIFQKLQFSVYVEQQQYEELLLKLHSVYGIQQ